MLLPGASNRDPRKFPDPNDQLDRKNVREHVGVPAGTALVPGRTAGPRRGPISMNRILDRMADIRWIASRRAPDARRYDFEPTFIMRG